MDERPDPQRIEIELTSHEPVTGGARAVDRPFDHDGVAPQVSDAADTVPLGASRRRLAAGVSVIALAALLLGVVVGRMGSREASDSDDAPAAVEPTVVATSTTARPEGVETLPAADPALTPPPTPPPTPTTTTAAASPARAETDVGGGLSSVEGRLEMHPSIPAADVEIVAMTNRGDIVRVDVATGATVTVEVAGSQFGAPSVHAGAGWILVPSFAAARESTVVFDDGTRSSIATGSSWPLLTTGTTGRFWLGAETTSSELPDRLVEMTIDGEATGAEIDLDGYIPNMIDPLGGVVVEAPGGSYIITPEATTRMTDGRLLGIGRERVFVQECDAQLACGYFVVDRASGERRKVQLDSALGDSPALEASGRWAFQEPWNRSEDALLVLFWDPTGAGRQSYGVLDLVDGGFQEIGGAIDVPTMRWGGDLGVFWLDQGRLRWFDRATGDSVVFSEDLGTLNAFTVRPADPAGVEGG